MLLRHVFRPIIGRSFWPIRIQFSENRPEFGVLHMRRNVKMGLGIDSYLLDMGNEQLLLGHENLTVNNLCSHDVGDMKLVTKC